MRRNRRLNQKARIMRSMIGMAAVCVVVLGFMYIIRRPSIGGGVMLATNAVMFNDTMLVEDRQTGLVNLEKFTDLVDALPGFDKASADNYSVNGDSVTFRMAADGATTFFNDFSNSNDITTLETRYKNFPIRVLERGSGFKAEIVKVEEVAYIRIPYLVLASVAGRANPYINGESRNVKNQGEKKYVNPLPSGGTTKTAMPEGKVEIEGLVRKNFFEIIAGSNSRSPERFDQLAVAWRYVKGRWQYIHDPLASMDTWRSASETIQSYYDNGKYYCGDCDDFAILMASFAQQVGCEWQCVCVNGAQGQHMYTRFREPGERTWHNMDWFSDKFDDTPYQGETIMLLGK